MSLDPRSRLKGIETIEDIFSPFFLFHPLDPRSRLKGIETHYERQLCNAFPLLWIRVPV